MVTTNRSPRSWTWARVITLALLWVAYCTDRARSQTTEPIVRSFLYVDAYQVRFELVLPLQTTKQWLQLPYEPNTPLQPHEQTAFKSSVAAASSHWAKLSLDGKALPAGPASVSLVQSSTAAAVPFPIEDNKSALSKDIHVTLSWSVPGSADIKMVEASLLMPLPGTSQAVTSVSVGDEIEDLPMTGNPPTLRWESKGRIPAPVAEAVMPPFSSSSATGLSKPSLISIAVGLLVLVFSVVKRAYLGIAAALVIAVAGGVLLRHVPASEVSKEQAQAILDPLIQNIYGALHFKAANGRLSRLERCASSTLLDKLQNTLLQHLQVADQTQLHTRVGPDQVSLDMDEFTPEPHGFSARVTWTAMGTIHHLGHPDTRVNRYKAGLKVALVDGVWKLTDLDIQEHRQM